MSRREIQKKIREALAKADASAPKRKQVTKAGNDARRTQVNLKKVIGKGYNEFWHSKHFYRVVKGSRGSKKSKTAALNFIYRIMLYPWSNLLVVRRFSNTNRQSTFTDMKWAAYKLGVDHLFRFNESLPEIVYIPTGQKILFRGLDDPLKITSISVDVGMLSWAWFEEAYQFEDMGAVDTVIESIRGSHEAPDYFKQITFTFNPWSERHWLKREFFDEETQRRNTLALTTTFRVNEWLDEVDRQRYFDLYRTNPRRAAIVCDGQWGIAEGLVFDEKYVVEFDWKQKIKELKETTHGMDFGFSHDPTTLVATVVDLERRELWIYEEHYEVGMDTVDIAKMLKKRNLHKTQITADGHEDRLVNELRRRHGIRRIERSVKGPDSVHFGVEFLKEFKIYIHPRCVNTIEEFETYTYQKDKEGNWLNKPIDKNNHIIDALRYSMERYHGMSKKSSNKLLQALGGAKVYG